MERKPELLAKPLEGVKTQEDLAGSGGLLKQITKVLVERMLAGELTHHLGYESMILPLLALATLATAKA